MKGKRVKQINLLTIRYTDAHGYAVWTPDRRCWEDRLSLEQAEDLCRSTTDFVTYQASSADIAYVEKCREHPLSEEDKAWIGRHKKRFHMKGNEICAWYGDWADFCSDWCGKVGCSKMEARARLHGGTGEFMFLSDGSEIIRFAM